MAKEPKAQISAEAPEAQASVENTNDKRDPEAWISVREGEAPTYS